VTSNSGIRLSDAQICASWHANALPWVTAVRTGQLESRVFVTNRVIVDAVLARAPHTVLDVGCGEGWLARELSSHGIRVTGIDVVPALIERAGSAGGGEFHIASYEDLAAGKLSISADVIVCNFSLLGHESVEGVFVAVARMLNRGGAFIVQTVHPEFACGTSPYQDGWREGSWDGFSSDFKDPAPWYFRTLDTWKHLFYSNKLRLVDTQVPLHPNTKQPASVLFIAEAESLG
jgi:2-polyprenyl-3-methyl-5-hydroxy-6-metoxy-1,4-benzoquinol methylase